MSWRDKYNVHPAADVFPMMSDDELKALGEDIKANGLTSPIVIDGNGAVLDGRNRLEAAERAGVILGERYHHRHTGDPAALIISLNIHRRHLTKQQQADLIVAAIKAGEKPDQVEPVSEKGGRGKKNKVKEKPVAAAAQHGISESTVKRSIAKAEGKTPKPKPTELDDDWEAWDAARKERVANRKADAEATRKANREYFEPRYGTKFAQKEDLRLAKVLAMLSSAHEGERQNAADAANKILEPMGWQLVKVEKKRASTLPQDGRSEVVMDDPAPELASAIDDVGEIPPCLDRRRGRIIGGINV
jgi:hypothetical protein